MQVTNLKDILQEAYLQGFDDNERFWDSSEPFEKWFADMKKWCKAI